MKPYGREKKVTGGNSWKTDYHPRPKKEAMNWWEDMCAYLSRSAMKKKMKEQINKDYGEVFL